MTTNDWTFGDEAWFSWTCYWKHMAPLLKFRLSFARFPSLPGFCGHFECWQGFLIIPLTLTSHKWPQTLQSCVFFDISAMPCWQTTLAFALGLSQVEHLEGGSCAIHLIGRKELMPELVHVGSMFWICFIKVVSILIHGSNIYLIYYHRLCLWFYVIHICIFVEDDRII